MYYEKSRKEFYKNILMKNIDLITSYLDNGYSVEICHSRSGLKMISNKKNHVVLNNTEDKGAK